MSDIEQRLRDMAEGFPLQGITTDLLDEAADHIVQLKEAADWWREALQGEVADERIVNALQEVADCTLFDAHDPTDCTEEVYETVSALIEDARAALQEQKE